MSLLNHTSALFLSALSLTSASAQVNKEITVERDVVLSVREVAPQYMTPVFSLPATPRPSLDYSQRTSTARIPALFSHLGPLTVADSIAASPWRGYASLGYFPEYNLGASAGYRLIDKKSTTLDAWLQYDGSKYSASTPISDKLSYEKEIWSHDAALGLRMANRLASGGMFNISAAYNFSRFNGEPHLSNDKGWQSVHRADINSFLISRVNDLGYSLGLDYSLFKFGQGYAISPLSDTPDGLEYTHTKLNPVLENRLGLSGALMAELSGVSSYTMNIGLSLLTRGKSAETAIINGDNTIPSTQLVPRGSDASALVSITPAYRLAPQAFSLDIGAKIDLSISDGRFFNIAPDVKATWTPTHAFALFARAGGGVHQNTMGSLYAVSRFTCPAIWHSNSRVPIEAEAGLRVGPFHGASLSASAAWAKAKDWLMPFNAGSGIVAFSPTDISGWQIKLDAAYSWRNIASASLSATYNPSSEGNVQKAYYTNRDHARYTLDASLTLRPIKPMEFTVGYELRACRSMRWTEEGLTFDYDHWAPISRNHTAPMANLANLRAGASWRFSQTFSIFLRAENILARHTPSFDLIPGQGFHGLAGIALKF
ncbi:MAG: hypothetical protein NC342_08995 [Pseudoflavonifractor sp.]|nr:hypothetical protein [Alloprevotella sp.]MCM1117657.1 hypothetical protein [Pseudoflavonifractor sp.]